MTGEAVGATVSARAGCRITQGAVGACGADVATFPSQVLVVGRAASGEAYQTFSGSDMSWGQGMWTYNFRVPGGSQAQLYDYVLPFRCDGVVPGAGAGCVFDYYTPTLWYSRASLPQFTAHVEGAQLSGLPGRTVPLHRLTDQTLRELNGRTACPSASWLPRPDGYQCDEYPFRSTYEGAATGGGTARTQSWCQVTLPGAASTGSSGYSICMIPKQQNVTAGSQLGVFYSQNRVADNDPFYVRMKV